MNKTKHENLFDLDVVSLETLTDVSENLLTDTQNTHIKGKKYIIFMLDETHFAIPVERISEAVRPLPITSLPNVPEWFIGIANLRGEVITIIDLQTLWNKKTNDSPKSKLIVLRPVDSFTYIAFKVDKLREIVTLSDEEIEFVENKNMPYLAGTVEHKTNSVNLINIEEVFASLKLN